MISAVLFLLNIVNIQSQSIIKTLEGQGALVSFSFRDSLGKEVKSYRSNQLMMPASTDKVLTTAAALNILGENFTYHTHLNAHGPIEQGTLKGSLVVLGMGDPSLGSGKAGALTAEETLAKLVELVTKAGIKSIEGDLIADPSVFRLDHTAVPRYWPFEDIGNYYGAGVYGINWRSNEFTASFTGGYSGSLIEAKVVEMTLFDVSLKSFVKTCTSEEEVIYMFGSPLENTIRIDGCVPSGQVRKERGSIPNPPWQFLNEFKLALNASGIKLKGKLIVSESFYKTEEGFTRLGEITSPHLSELVAETNIHSNNLFAEAFAKYLGTMHGKGSRAEEGAEVITKYLKESLNLDVADIQIVDGSGLSPFNMVSAAFQTEFLNTLKSSNEYSGILNSLPESGKSGTLRNFGNIPGLKSKSGSIKGVKTYMGYLPSKKYGELSFSVMVNHATGKSSEIKALILGLLKEMNQ